MGRISTGKNGRSRAAASAYLGAVDLGSLITSLAPFVGILIIGGLALVLGLWLGGRKIAPRIERALDRPETKDEPTVDRHD